MKAAAVAASLMVLETNSFVGAVYYIRIMVVRKPNTVTVTMPHPYTLYISLSISISFPP